MFGKKNCKKASVAKADTVQSICAEFGNRLAVLAERNQNMGMALEEEANSLKALAQSKLNKSIQNYEVAATSLKAKEAISKFAK